MRATLIFFLTAFFLITSVSQALAKEKESAYDRVMRTQTIRCVYAVGAPWISVDPNTGTRSGIMVDIMEEIGKALSMTIDWSGGEVAWGELGTAVESGRGDVTCSGMWAAANRARATAFTRPLFYTPIEIWARADDHRFDNAPERVNAPDVKIVVEDGDFNGVIAKSQFSKAQRISKPQLAGLEYYFLTLIDKKADVLLISNNYAQDFLNKRPGTIRKVPMPQPLRVYENVLGVNIREQELLSMVDAAVGDLLASGAMERIVKRYQKDYPGTFLMPAVPYETHNQGTAP